MPGVDPGRTQIPVTKLLRTGVVGASHVTGNDVQRLYFANNHGETLIEIVNRHASNLARVGFELYQPDVDSAMVENRITDAIPAGGTILCGPFPTKYYSRSDFGVHVNPVAGSAHSVWFRGFELETLAS